MFERYNDILCVEASWMIEAGVITMASYRNFLNRNHIHVERRGGYGRTALVAFDTMRQDLKDKIVEITGGNPHETQKNQDFLNLIDASENDKDLTGKTASAFFNSYRDANGESLSEPKIKQYIKEAAILRAVDAYVKIQTGKIKARGGKRGMIWKNIAEIVQELPPVKYPHKLPAHFRRLQDRLDKFNESSYVSLIHGNAGNANSEKINEVGKLWVLSRWCDQVNRCATILQLWIEYNHEATKRNWSPLKSEVTLRNYLNHGDVYHIWYAARHGELAAKEKFSYSQKTKMPSMRDSLWYSDGTKLNLFFQYEDKNGKMQIGTTMVYEVMDAYSELFLGYHVSDTENFEAQFFAYKMAIKTSGHKPYEIKYDGQGGHKKLTTGNFLNNLSRISVKTKPYNGKSKTIESAFGRFQMQYLKRLWYCTGQNITTKSLESKANMEFILANKDNLPTREEAIQAYLKLRNEWANAPHFATGIPRVEMYRNSINPETPEISLWDMVDLFWIQREKKVMCTSSGIEFTEKKTEYSYMVNGSDGLPDLKWLRENIDEKFIIKFDPEDMDMIYLYQEDSIGLKFITEAKTKVEVHRAAQEQVEGEQAFIRIIQKKENQERIDAHERLKQIQEANGRLPEQNGLRSPHLKGIGKRQKGASKTGEIGKYQKAVSNATALEEEEEEINIYNLM